MAKLQNNQYVRWENFTKEELEVIENSFGIASSESLVKDWELHKKLEKQITNQLTERSQRK